VKVRIVQDLGELPPASWDALAGDDDPFVEHRFLHALERSGSVGEKAGWVPVHVTVWEEAEDRAPDEAPVGGAAPGIPESESLVAALPLYAKDHSYGEYIFDWAWANAAMRLGLSYYPKIVSMVPVTPATGRRILVHPGLGQGTRRRRALEALLEGAFAAADAARGSSVHLLFLRDDEREALSFDPRLAPRLTYQFHWTNDGYGSFDDFLGRFRSSMRKQTRKERRRVAESDLRIAVKRGPELDEREWSALHRFYKDTCRRKGSYPYLTKRFFTELRGNAGERAVAALAYGPDDEPVAGSLNFEKGQVLYGRYWGCLEDYDMLHFELCYYRLIERAIDHGMDRFEAGAQGEHKLRRGLMPAPIHSLHWVRDPVLEGAVRDFLPREAAAVSQQMAELAEHGPFRRSGDS
jgi:hypothetical protein